MKENNRVFLIVLDSLGVGALPDAADYGDEGSDTLGALIKSGKLHVPTLESLGLFNIAHGGTVQAKGAYGKAHECSKGKDTTTGHWEIAGVRLNEAFPTYPNGFPEELLNELKKRTGIGWICNKPYSGTQVIKDYGDRMRAERSMIIYTSADSVLQVAAHLDIFRLDQLYDYCKVARQLSDVGRIIARPFEGVSGDYYRTSERHDFSLEPPGETILDQVKAAGKSVLGVGKIGDIFAGRGLTRSTPTHGNDDGMAVLYYIAREEFNGLCFANLVDFDMLYGHRNDVEGYANALNRFDEQLAVLLSLMKRDDLVIITGDHGCDPSTPSTDHSREYIPIIVAGEKVRQNANMGTRYTFADIAEGIAKYLGTPGGFGRSIMRVAIGRKH